jgi:hypothetical protein
MIDVAVIEPMTELDAAEAFWSNRSELDHILRFARYRRASPWAVLANVLRRATACVEPNVVLPAIVGGYASVNLYTAAAGRSGQGKGAAEGAGFDSVRFIDESHEPIATDQPNPGSGEGLARLFKGRSDEDRTVTRAHLIVPEVGTLAALAGRQGATLTTELLKAFSGEPLGFANASKETSTAIAAHSYRLCLGVGVQPQNADFFLSRAKDGLPQRFVWVPTSDREAPLDAPPPVEPIDVTLQNFGHERYAIAVPSDVKRQIDRHRVRVLREDPDIDPLDGHLMLTRLKASFAFALLAGRQDIDLDDWDLAGELIDRSTVVRNQLQVGLDDRRRRENQSKALEAADRDAIIAARLNTDAEQRVASAMTKKLERVGTATRRELRQACAANLRDYFDPVFEMLLDRQLMVAVHDSDSQVGRFRLP